MSIASGLENPSSRARHLPWQEAVAGYQEVSLRHSLWQLLTSIVPFFLLWYLAYRSLSVSYWLTLPFVVLAALFSIRIFIIFHDCGHGAFFKSRKANDLVGIFTGVLTFTPYYTWRHSHALHHASSGDLDRRSPGTIWTLTYNEYQQMSFWKRLCYRIYHNPFVLFLIAPAFEFIVLQRLPLTKRASKKREKRSIWWTNLLLLGIAVAMHATIGLAAYVAIQLSITILASSMGVWLFYVQHQYENAYWERHEEWDFATAALYGSSFYKLPRVLQWFTGNIGFHHIHHLNPRIPNYRLQACHDENPIFHDVTPLTLRTSLQSLRLRLWDEEERKMIGFTKP